MKDDIRMLLVAGVGVAFLAWAVANTGAIGSLVQTSVSGYGGVIHALEPPQGLASSGNITPSTVMPTSFA